MSERTPLLRVRPPVTRQEQKITRYAGVILTGFVLYCVYLVLFLPRTSYQRDWNHLHGNAFTRQETERFIVQNTSNNEIYNHAQSYYLSGPHMAGSPALAEWTMAKFEGFGLKTKLETVTKRANYPGNISVRVLDGASTVIDLDLAETPIEIDPPTGLDEQIPPFHAYAADGNVTGKLVNVNYGRHKDYARLTAQNIPVKGRIVLIRSAHIPVHILVKTAKDHGAAAALVYNDDEDDGLREGDGYLPYPKGPARNPTSVQRDTVLDYTTQPGEPPLSGIPSIPISLNNARLLQRHLGTDGVSTLDIEVVNYQHPQEVALNNVFGVIPGVSKEQVIVGNRRDALVLGATDGNSGSAVLLEMARVLGDLYKRGWKPYRSIVFASWDGGKHGMLGSTAWAEENRHKLRKRTVSYIDIGPAFTGPEFVAKSSPLLRKVIRDCARRAPSPDLKGTLDEYWEDGSHHHTHVGTLATGDFNAFYNFLGIPSMTAKFQANKTSPVYHAGSHFDTLHWQKEYGDKDFKAHAALARLLGMVTASLAQSSILPLRVTEYARTIQRSALILVGERIEDKITHFHESCTDFLVAATHYDQYLQNLETEYVRDYPWYKFWKKLQLGLMMHVANLKLLQLEGKFLYRPGLTFRPWYRHAFIGPDSETGETRALPGLYEASINRDNDEMFYWAGVLSECLTQATNSLA